MRLEDAHFDRSPQIARYAATTAEALLSAMCEDRRGGSGPLRVAVLNPTPARLARAHSIVQRGRSLRGQLGLFFSNHDLLRRGGRTAFVFPGFDARFEPRLDGLERLSEPLPALVASADLEGMAVNILRVNRFMERTVQRLNILPHAVAGHSVGDTSALLAAGILDVSGMETLC